MLALRITVNMHTSTFVCSHMVCGPTDTDQSLGRSRKGWEGGSRDPPRLDYDGRAVRPGREHVTEMFGIRLQASLASVDAT